MTISRIDDSADENSPQTAAESAEFPALRVANDFDEVEAELSEVCQQIEHIEETPARTEDDFQPLGTNQPEIELVFTDADHPFKEEFEHEEVITDRYAASIPAPNQLLQQPTSVTPHNQAEITAINTVVDQGQLEGTPSLQSAGAAQAAETAESTVPTENNDPQTPRSKPRPIGATRRHEYGRLFAKLLQGTSP